MLEVVTITMTAWNEVDRPWVSGGFERDMKGTGDVAEESIFSLFHSHSFAGSTI